MTKDRLYAEPIDSVDDFVFDAQVVGVFDDMISRSVPGYRYTLALSGLLAKQYQQPGTAVYDLGVSTGSGLREILRQSGDRRVQYVGVDSSADMVRQAKQNLAPFAKTYDLEIICDSVQNIGLHAASVVVMNYTLQFVNRADRYEVLNKIYNALVPGGILLLSEKLDDNNIEQADVLDQSHVMFKKQQGYSEIEISQKRSALENVMQLDSESTHIARLKEIGFTQVVRYCQFLQFASYVAIR